MTSDHDKETLIAFGNRMKVLRMEKELSQEALAHSCGLDRSYIGGVERGERNVSLVNIIKIARGLGIHPKALFEFEGL